MAQLPQKEEGAGPVPCENFRRYGFCSYGLDCEYEHGALPQRGLQELNQELIQMGLRHTENIYKCVICGHHGTDGLDAKVGETAFYRYCSQCGNFFFYPHVQVIVLKILENSGTDYMLFKKTVDAYHRRLPSIVQVPFMYEAHRWATSRYAWSLTGPDNAKEILQAIFKEKNDYKRIVSMGSGTGYIEHVYLNSARDLGHEIEIRAFDLETPKKNRIKFDVQVEVGDVTSLKGLGDMSDTVLLLCWPPFGSQRREESKMAFDCLTQYASQGGNHLIYIGDVNATGDWRYHDLLSTHWEILEETFSLTKLDTWVPQNMGLIYAGNDSIGIYRKRAVPLQMEPRVWRVTA